MLICYLTQFVPADSLEWCECANHVNGKDWNSNLNGWLYEVYPLQSCWWNSLMTHLPSSSCWQKIVTHFASYAFPQLLENLGGSPSSSFVQFGQQESLWKEHFRQLLALDRSHFEVTGAPSVLLKEKLLSREGWIGSQFPGRIWDLASRVETKNIAQFGPEELVKSL